MTEIIRYLIILIVFATLTASGSLIATVNAFSCPRGSPVGIMVGPFPGPYRLPIENWNAHVGTADGILKISSVGVTGNIRGTLFTGNATNAGNPAAMALCTVAHPCQISGSFDAKTGRISFTSHPTIPTFAAVIQNYIGYESSRVEGIELIHYTLDGIGTTVKPVPGIGFGWDASISCIAVGGPCSGGSR